MGHQNILLVYKIKGKPRGMQVLSCTCMLTYSGIGFCSAKYLFLCTNPFNSIKNESETIPSRTTNTSSCARIIKSTNIANLLAAMENLTFLALTKWQKQGLFLYCNKCFQLMFVSSLAIHCIVSSLFILFMFTMTPVRISVEFSVDVIPVFPPC